MWIKLAVSGVVTLSLLTLGFLKVPDPIVTAPTGPGEVQLQRGPDYCVTVVDTVETPSKPGCNFAVGDTVCFRCVSGQSRCPDPVVLNTSKCGRVVMHAISANCTGCPKGAKKITP